MTWLDTERSGLQRVTAGGPQRQTARSVIPEWDVYVTIAVSSWNQHDERKGRHGDLRGGLRTWRAWGLGGLALAGLRDP